MQSPKSLSIAVCQMTSTDDVDANLMQMEGLIELIPQNNDVKLALFPENCLYQRLIESEAIHPLQLGDEAFQVLSHLAQTRGLHLHLGALPLRIDGHVYNSSVHISPIGEVTASYQKMHLFDIELKNGPRVRESDVYRHGQSPAILDVDGWKFGQAICYDVRFAELFSVYARHEIDAILLPSAFLMRTGELHWEVLLRARAIESQVYLVASAQAGLHRSNRGHGVRETWGHSMVVDPWGCVLLDVNERKPVVRVVTLEKKILNDVREQIPMIAHRRIPIVM